MKPKVTKRKVTQQQAAMLAAAQQKAELAKRTFQETSESLQMVLNLIADSLRVRPDQLADLDLATLEVTVKQ